MFIDIQPKILIVDDLEETRFLARNILRRNGNYEFFEAENGKEGVEIAFREIPHLILMDALMPVMNGFEAISILRSDPRTSRIPILMISGLNTQDDKIKALSSGISDFIAKPFEKTELIIRVNSLLNLYLNYLHKEEELSAFNLQLERKVAERTYELNLKKNYTRSVLDSTPNLICVFDSFGEITDTNQAWNVFFSPINLGICKSDFVFLKPHIPEMDDPQFLNAYDTKEWLGLLLHHGERSYKLRISNLDECFLFSVNARMMHPSGEAHLSEEHAQNHFIVTLNDISELERIREERESQIKLASIGKLAAGITHEINTPLTYIKGNIELMRMDLADISDSPAKTDLLSSMQSVEEGLHRISNIIDATREITKKGSGQKEKTNVYATLVYAARMVYNRTKHVAPIYMNGEVFDLDLAADTLTHETMAIKEKLEQVWIIILNNAADEFLNCEKAFEERWIKIDISIVDHQIQIRFSDNARGIPAKILPNIFEPFVSSKTHSGIGIGLNIAQSIIHEHEGEIAAHNEDGGAVFTVTLPLQ